MLLQRLRRAGDDARARPVARALDVALPDRADRGAAERRRAHRHARPSPPRARTGTCAACASATPTASESELDADACFVFIGASPRTDWLEGVVARDERGFILAGPRRAGRRLAAQARPVPARDDRAGRVRGRRRARALVQARRQRRRRGLDGRLADPPVPRRRMSAASPPSRSRSCAAIDLFDDLDDEQLAEWLPVTQPLRGRAGRDPRRARASRRRACSCCSRARSQTLLVDGDHVEPVGRHYAPTWMGAIAALTGARSACACSAETACRMALVEPDGVPPARVRPAGRAPARDAAGRAGDEPHHRRSSRTASG